MTAKDGDPAPAQDGPPRPPLWAYALALAVLAALGWAFGEAAEAARSKEPDGLDRHVLAWVVRHRDEWPGLTRFFRAVTWLGNTQVATASTILIAVALLALGRRRVGNLRKREAFFWLGVAIGGRTLDLLMKAYFQRARPPSIYRLVTETSFSFPSGHSVFAAILFTMLAILTTRALPTLSETWRVVVALLCILMALLVGASRVWLTVHYLSDVAGGLVLGLAWVEIAYLLRFGWRHWREWRTARLDGARAG
jgi:undecaprenyl-diphosphatase